MAIQPEPYFAFPSLFGAPAYSRPPNAVATVERPLDPDDLPLATYQTEDERRLADALLRSRGTASDHEDSGLDLPGGGHPGYRAEDHGQNEHRAEPLPRRLGLRDVTERIRHRS